VSDKQSTFYPQLCARYSDIIDAQSRMAMCAPRRLLPCQLFQSRPVALHEATNSLKEVLADIGQFGGRWHDNDSPPIQIRRHPHLVTCLQPHHFQSDSSILINIIYS
jgi:hypothetical protein